MEDFTACAWDAASVDRAELDTVQSAARGHEGAAVITSCQRTEAYLLRRCACGAPEQHSGFEALLRLAEVAAGLDSIVLGEEQIMGQVRAALATAPRPIRELGALAVAAARELRRQTAFNAHSGHLLDRALKRADTPAEGSLLVIGTGHMARLVARRGLELGFTEIRIAGRHAPHASWFMEGTYRFEQLETLQRAAPADVAVGCLGSGAPELDPETDLPTIRRLVIDLGTPRNFTLRSAASPIPTMTIAGLLDRTGEGGHRGERRAALRDQLRTLLERRLEMARTTRRTPAGELRAAVEALRQEEVARIHRLHPEIPADTVEVITRSLVNRLFHRPSQRLQDVVDTELAQALAGLFVADAPTLGNEDGNESSNTGIDTEVHESAQSGAGHTPRPAAMPVRARVAASA